jgi:hypothetical protein
MEIDNYNKEVRKFLNELGLKVSALSPVFGISKDMVSQKFMEKYPRPAFTEEDFHKIITYFKEKSNAIYNKHIYVRNSKD